jgi:hypothetical protein
MHMAKINVEFDTVEKTMTCTVDGKALANVQGVMFGKGYSSKRDEYTVEVVLGDESEDDDMRTWTRICAADTVKGRELVADGATPRADLPGFVSLPQPSDEDAELKAELLDFWGKDK